MFGCLTHWQLRCWEALTSDPWVVSTLSQGYSIPFRYHLPGFRGVKRTIVKDPNKALALHQEVCALLKKGTIEPLDSCSQNSGFYFTYFLIPKKDGRFFPILHLRLLNTYLKVLKFHMLHRVDLLQGIMQND